MRDVQRILRRIFPMKIEAGKYYKTKSGSDVFIVSVTTEIDGKPTEPGWEVRGYIRLERFWQSQAWHLNGLYCRPEKTNLDLIKLADCQKPCKACGKV